MTEEQTKALDALMGVECNIDPKGCGNQWCETRALVATAFGLEVKKPEPEAKPEAPDKEG